MPRRLPASLVSLLLALPAFAAGDDLVVPEGKEPVLDGRIGEEEWADAAPFEFLRDENVLGKARIKRVGRQLFLALRTDQSPWALGIRFNFTDPVTRRTHPVLVTALHPPRPPLAAFRQAAGGTPEAQSCAGCDVRFDFSSGLSMEMRLPLDLLEFTRTDQEYRFSAEMWDLANRRAFAVHPFAVGAGGGLGTRSLRPDGDWGADVPVDAPVPAPNGALALLEGMTGVGAPPEFFEHTGWNDGRRKDAPLAALEERLRKEVALRPDYVSLRGLLVQVCLVRNDLEGALAALDALGESFPQMASTPSHILLRLEMLRDLGRYAEALAFMDAHKEVAGGDPRFDALRPVLVYLRDGWEQELAIRKEEAEKDDLPRVRLDTDKGAIVLELLEDDAPNAVASFLSLVESGAYAGTRFHWVEGGRRVIGGDPNSKDDDPHNDGFGDPGYLIESEPGRRRNFPYMVTLADKRRERETEGATFVIHISPLPSADGMNTVFARVVEGQDVVRRLEYYDAIEKATVVRKRAHPYVPVKRP